MKTTFALLGAVLLFGGLAYAKQPLLGEKGTLLEMEAVACGTEAKNADGKLKSAVLGNDPEHVRQQQLLCQEYVLETDRMTYRIRPEEQKHPVLLPVGETVEFQIKKDYMLLRVRELDPKVRKFSVTSITQREQPPAHKESAKAQQ